MGKHTVLRMESRSKSAQMINGYNYKYFAEKPKEILQGNLAGNCGSFSGSADRLLTGSAGNRLPRCFKKRLWMREMSEFSFVKGQRGAFAYGNMVL